MKNKSEIISEFTNSIHVAYDLPKYLFCCPVSLRRRTVLFIFRHTVVNRVKKRHRTKTKLVACALVVKPANHNIRTVIIVGLYLYVWTGHEISDIIASLGLLLWVLGQEI
jgi:hypothetical protein